MAKGNKIHIDLKEDVFDRVKRQTELKSRLHDDLTEQIVITDSDKPALEDYFADFIASFRNDTGAFDRVEDYDNLFVYVMTEDEEARGFKHLKQLIIKTMVEYLLWQWYESIGASQFATEAGTKYQYCIREFLNHNARKAFVQPKYRPYF